jgi:two-component system, OmpR family, phosphate regulon response regulator PhoB
MQRVLICDDEPDLAALVELNLKDAGFAVEVAHTGEEALSVARQTRPDLVLLDLMLPDISGSEVCRRLKGDPLTAGVPVMMLTARSEEPDRVSGFEAGADDYVTKPFSVRELVLRVKAVLRRQGPAVPAVTLQSGKLRIDVSAHRAYVENQEVTLTALEFKLLHHLLINRGRVQSREVLLQEVWGLSSQLETRTVDTHMMRLRDKLAAAREQVETVRGIGYRLAPDELPITLKGNHL